MYAKLQCQDVSASTPNSNKQYSTVNMKSYREYQNEINVPHEQEFFVFANLLQECMMDFLEDRPTFETVQTEIIQAVDRIWSIGIHCYLNTPSLMIFFIILHFLIYGKKIFHNLKQNDLLNTVNYLHFTTTFLQMTLFLLITWRHPSRFHIHYRALSKMVKFIYLFNFLFFLHLIFSSSLRSTFPQRN